MGKNTFQGPVRSLNGFFCTGPGMVKDIANGTNTITLDVDTYAGRIITTNDATLVITLPPINVAANGPYSGPGSDPNNPNNQGASFFIFIETAATAVAITTNGTDKFVGSILMVDTDTAGAVSGYAPAASNDVINLNGTTTGGIVGSWVKITALDSLKYFVEGVLLGSGTVATPFADA
jgi:hypothetical protein